VAPDLFLPVAEQTHLIVELDFIILRRSVEILATLPTHLNVAVNVSAVTLAHEEYAGWVRRALTLFEVDPGRLHLEFTETALLTITDRVRRTMADLAGIGVGWYVDDFGTGYSSIAHLRDLPIAGLKLDTSFAAGIGAGDANSERIARALLGLAEGLSLDTVAEGVETPDVAVVLAEQGWRYGQGWLYGHARPAPDILAGR
jgi:EAL domain-containing protein (putative c-di-GMP-specific phosphodiesterase class I)